MTAWAHIQIFPECFIRLNKETLHHPKLMERLANHPAAEWEIKMAEIAAYCEVILDGYYLPSDMEKIAGVLYNRLVLMREDNRGILIVSSLPQ